MADNKTRLGVSAYAIVVFVYALGANGVRNLLHLWGFFGGVVVLLIIGLLLFARLKPERFRWYRLPMPLYWFLALAALSILWSQYQAWSAIGLVAQLVTTAIAVVLAFVLTWHELLRTLATALRYLLAASLLFEAWVSIFVRHPIMPWWYEQPEPGEEVASRLLYWSRDLLFEGGMIQGVVGSSVILGFIALLALIVFAIQLRAGLVRPFTGWFWVLVAIATLALTRSATIWVALAAVCVALALALWARRLGPAGRIPLYATGAAAVLAALAAALFARDFVFGLLGKSGTLTGRTETWEAVIALAEQRPWFGWGWVSYWPTWVPPFDDIDTQAGLAVPSAHNAWLDVWFQLGIVGMLVFAPLVMLTVSRTWFRAVDPPRRGPGPARPYATSALWPFLVMVALVVQSLTESRLLIEWGWLLLVIFAVKSRFDFELPSQDAEPTKQPWRRVPIPRDTADTGLIR